MGLFKTAKPSYLGIDIGSNTIKLVELKNEGGRPRLSTYAFLEEEVDIVHDNSPEMEDKTAALIKKACVEAKTTTEKTIASLPSFSVFSSVISLPNMGKKDIEKAVYWQAKKFVPMNLEEMTLDWKVLDDDIEVTDIEGAKEEKGVESLEGDSDDNSHKKNKQVKKSKKGNDLKVLIAASPIKLVQRYMSVFEKAELDLLSLETENFALERSLVGGDKNPVMIVDIGSLTTDISVVENSIPVLNRSVDIGGSAITKSIMNSMHVDKKRAEQFKRDIGFSGENNNLPKVIETVITPIINEIKYCFDLYSSHQSANRIEKVILTGGSSFLPNIDEYLSNLLNIKVYIGDPWDKVIYPVELKSNLQRLAPRFSVAVGLAMREII